MYLTRLLTLPAILLLLCLNAFAQNQPIKASLSGRIVDGQKKPVAYVTVALLRDDSTVVNGDLTQEDGNFRITLEEVGTFSLRISGIGFNARTIDGVEITVLDPNKKLGNVTVQTSSKVLDEVKVTGERPLMEMSVDKKVFNVEKNITTAGGSAADVLQNVPSVSVDADGGVSLRGKSNVTILIDGKPATLLGGDVASALQSLPAASISNVEVITNPSAKYDAQGMTGIVNIITKKDKKTGINGSITAGVGTRDKYNGGLNLNLKNDKWNVFLNSNLRMNRNYHLTTTNRHNLSNSYEFETYEDFIRRFNGFFNTIGAEYTINNRNSITLTENINLMQWGGKGVSTFETYSAPGYLASTQKRSSDNLGSPFTTSTSVDYKHKFAKPKQEFTTNVTYATTVVKRTQNFYTSDYDSNEVELHAPITQRAPGGGGNQSLNAQADFTTPFINKTAKLEAGLKTQLFWFNSKNDPTIDSGAGPQPFEILRNVYNYNQNIHAAYTNLSDQRKNWTYQAGLRAEYATYEGTDLSLKGKAYTNEYLSLFPSAYVSYKLPKDQTMFLNYSRITNRPSFMQLMPYIDFSNPQDTGMGNPDLRPEFIHNIELNYSRQFKKGHNIMAGAYYQYTQNLIERYRIFYADGTSFNQPRNLYAGTTYGLDLTGRAQILPIWDAMLNVNLFQNKIEGSNIDSTIDNSGFGWFAKLNTNVKLSKTFSLQVNGNYEGPKPAAQSRVLEAYWLDVALRKTFWDGNATIVLNVSDIFNTRKFTTLYNFDQYEQSVYRDRETRIANLTFTYRFGRSDIKTLGGGRRKSQNSNVNDKERNNLKSDDNGEQSGF